MKKILITCLIVMFCGAANAQENQETFAVVWDWSTGDREAVNSNLASQATQLLDLWRKGIVENVYLNTDAKLTDDEPMPNVIFFIKAKDEQAAKGILNETVFVENSIAQYKLYPVGKLWLINYEDFQKIHKGDKPIDD